MRSIRLNKDWPPLKVPITLWDVRTTPTPPKTKWLMVLVGGRVHRWEPLTTGNRWCFDNDDLAEALNSFDWNALMFLGPRQDNGIISTWIRFAYEKFKTA